MSDDEATRSTTAHAWYSADDWSMWEITGNYPAGNGTFTACLAVVLPRYTHGTDGALFRFVGPLADLEGLVDPSWITDARPLLLVDRGDPTKAYWEHDQPVLDDNLRTPPGVCTCDGGPTHDGPFGPLPHRDWCRADEPGSKQ